MATTTDQWTFLKHLALLIQEIERQGYTATGGELWRTPEMAEIYAKRGTGIKNSLHISRLAIDLNLFKDGVWCRNGDSYKPFGVYWESLDPKNRYGGNWDRDATHGEKGENDFNHFERRA